MLRNGSRLFCSVSYVNCIVDSTLFMPLTKMFKFPKLHTQKEWQKRFWNYMRLRSGEREDFEKGDRENEEESVEGLENTKKEEIEGDLFLEAALLEWRAGGKEVGIDPFSEEQMAKAIGGLKLVKTPGVDGVYP